MPQKKLIQNIKKNQANHKPNYYTLLDNLVDSNKDKDLKEITVETQDDLDTMAQE